MYAFDVKQSTLHNWKHYYIKECNNIPIHYPYSFNILIFFFKWTTELHPKVGPTYLPLLLVVSNFTSTLNNHHKSRIRIIIFKAIPDERRYFHLFPPYFCHVDISWHWSTMQVNMQKHLSAPGRQRAKLLLGNRRGLWAKWSIWPPLQGGNLWPEGYKQVRAIIESFWFLHFIFSSW